MSYKTKSPVKQIWLPIEYSFLEEYARNGKTFKIFSDAYKKEYGIDLHDLFKLCKDNNDRLYISLPEAIIGSYTNSITFAPNSNFYTPQAIKAIGRGLEGSNTKLIDIGVEPYVVGDSGFGFNIITEQNISVDSIDDLIVYMWEY